MIDEFWDNPFFLDEPIDFNPGDFPPIDPISGMDPSDPFYGLSDDDWRTIFGDVGGPTGGYSGGSGGSGGFSVPSWLRSLFGGGGRSGGAGGGLPSWLMGLLGAGGTIYGGINQ